MPQDTPQKTKSETELFEFLYQNLPTNGTDVPLTAISARDRVWNYYRNETATVGDIYALKAEFERYGERMGACSGYLKFGIGTDGFKLKEANFCRVRYCPVCQWRKTLYWNAKMHQKYDELRKQYPTHRFLFLTLTIKNPPIDELRQTLQNMNKAWKKLTTRKEFDVVDGWIRTTEVTRDKKRPNTHAHPHFHIILMVKPSYFGKKYLKQADWTRLWADCLGVDYLPTMDIKAVRTKNNNKNTPITEDDIKSAIINTLKYAIKPSDIIGNNSPKSREWFYELTRQTHKLRFIATGGALKNILSDDEPKNQELITTTNNKNSETDKKRLNFTYYKSKRKYLYNPQYNE